MEVHHATRGTQGCFNVIGWNNIEGLRGHNKVFGLLLFIIFIYYSFVTCQ